MYISMYFWSKETGRGNEFQACFACVGCTCSKLIAAHPCQRRQNLGGTELICGTTGDSFEVSTQQKIGFISLILEST